MASSAGKTSWRALGRIDRIYLVRRDGFIVAEVPSPGTGAALVAARARLAGA